MAKANILIAEDDPLLRNIYTKKFALADYAVNAVADGGEAIEAILKQSPDLLILDINMPKVDGFQVMEHFPHESRNFPIILLTNFDQEDYRLRGKQLGADGFFIKKDMTIRLLVTMVEDLLKGLKK